MQVRAANMGELLCSQKIGAKSLNYTPYFSSRRRVAYEASG